jgi:diacylglycerol kinase (ATP)
MQIHFAMLLLVLVSGLMLRLDETRMVLLLFSISLVIATEMLNTAVETVVDMVTRTYHPLAKLAKDVAAGAVLVASLNAVVAGSLIFWTSDNFRQIGAKGIPLPQRGPDAVGFVVVGLMVLTVAVIMSKLLQGRSNAGVLRGGVVSGHSAIGFFLAMTIVFTTEKRFVMLLALLMAVIIAQSRVEAGIHSLQEVVLGAVVAIFLTSSVYWLMPSFQAMVRP